jgi:hypothetical protein
MASHSVWTWSGLPVTPVLNHFACSEGYPERWQHFINWTPNLGYLLKQVMALFFLPLVAVALSVPPVSAQSYDLRLGDSFLGTLVYEEDVGVTRIKATLSNTPLGLFNGTFEAVSRSVPTTSGKSLREYQSLGVSSRKTREIAVLLDREGVVETRVRPQSERTNLSNPDNVVDIVIDPVSALGVMLSAAECPSDLRFYDGRRVILLSMLSSQMVDGELSCELSYSVIAGPGHLSPLYIHNMSLTLSYNSRADTQVLSLMQLSAGLWSLNIVRRD